MQLLRNDDDSSFTEFVMSHRGRLLATAQLLAGGDVHLAEDLVQTALVKVYLSWRKVRKEPGAYARRVLVNAFIDHRRKPSSRREQTAEELPPHRAVDSPADLDAPDPQLVAALAGLPDRMRAAVVLRHVHDLSVADTAELLGCTEGIVKSQTARGLDKLRHQLQTPTFSTTGDPR